jgi:aspartate/tyrosine/aromatic aminotransferase
MLESIPTAPPDAILGLTEAFRADPNPDKINLTVGVYQDAQGKTPILRCVKDAEAILLREETSKSYLAIDGDPDFDRLVQELLFGAGHDVLADGRMATLQTPGGTGAVRLAADFLRSMLPSARVWCSQPTWPNHPNIFQAAGLKVEFYPYFDPAQNALDFAAMLERLGQIPSGEVVLLHACCHNPTGVDPTGHQWNQIADVIYDRGLLPLVDFAYQGFGEGLDEDAAGVRALCRPGCELLVCSSFSKNFGLYSERVGALSLVGKTRESTRAALSQLKRCARVNYSNPPAHGAAIVATVLTAPALRRAWEQELGEMRARINGMRDLLAATIKKHGLGSDFSFIRRQRGMFSFSGLSPAQVDQLRQRHSIYVVRDGRINVAGIREANVQRLCEAIGSVL